MTNKERIKELLKKRYIPIKGTESSVDRNLDDIATYLSNTGVIVSTSAKEITEFMRFDDLNQRHINQLECCIKDLREQLENAIIPKVKVGQEVWAKANDDKIRKGIILKFANGGIQVDWRYDCFHFSKWQYENELFPTKAEQALGEKNDRIPRTSGRPNPNHNMDTRQPR